jgi:DNA processing protein
MSDPSQRDAHIALALTPGVGPRRFGHLLERFGTPLGALMAPSASLGTVPGISRAAATAISNQSPDAGVRVRREVEELGGRCLVPDDPAYPSILNDIPDPPLVLFAIGSLDLLDAPAVALVGSRDHSSYGGRMTRSIAAVAAKAGVVVVSGMARGLDAEAHAAALDAGGGTIGVLGNGLGVVYPAANRKLYRRVEQEGLLLTEFPPGEKPHAGSFPRRNRVISGLAQVTVVVEAASGSGTLITVGAALEQGREVMAVPGNVTSPTSVGTNGLLRDGATPLLLPTDLLAYYDSSPVVPETVNSPPRPKLTPEEERVFGALGRAPVHLDVLARTINEPIAAVLDRLCALELAGLIEQHPGRLFVRGER